jgi:hypothetical protein
VSTRAAAYAVLRIGSLAIAVAILMLLGTRRSSGAPSPGAAKSAPAGDVERGRYLAHDVAMCVQCHTPRNADGTLDETRLFEGATIPLTSPFPGERWATQSPAIAGLGVFNEDDEMSLLTTGQRRDGKRPLPPMPSFRLKPDDARAVIAYLRSLNRGE